MKLDRLHDLQSSAANASAGAGGQVPIVAVSHLDVLRPTAGGPLQSAQVDPRVGVAEAGDKGQQEPQGEHSTAVSILSVSTDEYCSYLNTFAVYNVAGGN